MSKERKTIYEFGAFRLDPEERRLSHRGQAVDLTPKALNLLVILVENAGHLQTKTRLKERLWPDTHVDDANLTVTIRTLRLALGNGENGNPYIETVPREGYRFILPVTKIEEPSRSSAPDDLESQAETPVSTGRPAEKEQPVAPLLPDRDRKFRFPGLRRAGVSAAVLAVAAIAYGLMVPRGQPAVLKYTRLTYQGHEIGAMLATDGVRLYFQEVAGDKHLIGAVPVSGNGEPAYISIPFRTPYLNGVFPGAESLLVKDGSPNGTFWKQPLPGGSPQPLGQMRGVGISLSPDGKRYAQIEGGRTLTVTGLDGSGARSIYSSDHSLVLGESWSPDGKMICFLRLDPEADRGADVFSIYSIDADGSNLRELVSPKARFEGISACNWTPDKKYLLFGATIGGKADLWATPDHARFLQFADPKPVRLTNNPVEFSAPVAGLDGRTIFALGSLTRGELVRYDQKAHAWLPFMDGLSAGAVDFSRDGKWVAWVRHPEGTLWRSRIDGTEPLQLTFPPFAADGPHWSPDGRLIAFRSSLPGRPRKIFTIPADGGIPQKLLPANSDEKAEDQKEEGIPTWSSDGGLIAFGGLRYSPDKIAIHVVERATGKLTTLPGSEGLWTSRWSPDGRHLLALTADGTSSISKTLVLFDFSNRKWQTLVRDSIADPVWSPDGQFIYYTTGDPDPAVMRTRVSNRMTEKIVDLRGFGREWDPSTGVYFGVAPDNSPLMLRKVHETEIYALSMKW